MKDVKVKEETHRKLIKMKYDLGADNLNEVIEALIKISTKSKLASELR